MDLRTVLVVDVLRSVSGMPMEDAKRLIAESGFSPRVTRIDKGYFMCTRDYRADRINLEVDGGIVTSVSAN